MRDPGGASAATPNPAPGFARHPGHSIDLQPCPERQRAHFSGLLVADSRHALIVREANYPPVIYFPRADVNMHLMQPTTHSSHCPFKGDASYWSIAGGQGLGEADGADGADGENAAWSYERPYDEMMALKGYIAFYSNRIRVCA